MTQSDSADLTALDPILAKYPPNGFQSGRPHLIPVLFETQAMYGHLTEPALEAISRHLRVPLAEIHGVIEFYTMLYRRPVGDTIIRICTSPTCAQLGGKRALESACQHLGVEVDQPTPDGKYMVEEAPCLGLCDHAPAGLIGETPVAHLDPDKPASFIKKPAEAPLGEIGGNLRWLTSRCGQIKPTSLKEFKKAGGFTGLQKALESGRDEVIQMIKDSGLVGRGGAAFPTGLKLEFTASAEGDTKYVVCNADESEPGTFKDRVLMEGDPFSIIEGMAVSGYAIGAKKGYIYIRGEYPRARGILTQAIQAVVKDGYLGEKILGSDFNFEIEIHAGAGAYICGEETALFESIEGKRGFPRLKPPFPTTHGLFGKPTAINNVETLCTMAWIMANGVEAYRSAGTEKSPGSKLFCLSGDISKPGVYEVAFGTPLKELIEMAGGAKGDIQAILLGGAAGMFAGPDQLDVHMSFEDLQAAGLSLGSGVVVVINSQRDMRQTLLSLAHFFAHESCGKCYPCQLGTRRQLEIIAKVAEKSATKADLAALSDVGFAMTNASLCGLGMTAGTAILSAMELWPEVFESAG
jgi:NADH-quinone oxidoreductase subunit F